MESVERFLDEEGRVRQWPSKLADKAAVLRYLASKFDAGRTYSETEVNELLKKWHTFHDWPLLRRELFEAHMVTRNRNGSNYQFTEVKDGEGR